MPETMENVITSLRMLEAVGDHQPVGVSALARITGVPKTTVHRSLETLWAAGWLDRSADGAWSLSLRCAVIGRRAGQRRGLRALSRPAMTALAHACQESVQLWLPQGHMVVLAESIDGQQPVRLATPGALEGVVEMHASAAGKAILALLPGAEVDVLLGRELVRCTPHTITDVEVLRSHLADVRRRGYAVAREEGALGIGAVGAAITAGGRPVAGMSVPLPVHRLTDERVEQLGALVRRAACEISI